ncbi:hypothetical protein HF086_011953 [Spodoptera exigua]|uniref:Uncharacterized protein n=1 Tax=Spodoptera exigua TaxID=7107 RepID=A0A922SBH5_SPOEX|nr:hypothetical protein HF086_011953 [Spodoptera exigua]
MSPASATWPDLKDTAQFERAASAIMGGRPHTISAEMPQALYVNMSELATLAASRAQQHNAEHPPQEKVCSESSASESSLESSSGYGSQGAFAAEDHAIQHQVQHADVDSEIVTLRRESESSVAAARESFSISLGSLEEAVRSLDEACETPAFATIGKKPAVPKRRPVSMSGEILVFLWDLVKNSQNSQLSSNDADNLPPPPAFLLQPEGDTAHSNVAETVKQLTELKHMPASPGLVRRNLQQLHQNQPQSPTTPSLSTFQQAKSNFSSSTSLNSTGNLNPIYGQTGHKIMAYVENSMYVRKNSLNSSNSDLINAGQQDKKYGQSTIYAQPSEIIAGFNSMSRHDPRHDALSPLALRRNIAARSHSADRHHLEQGGLIAHLSAKLAPQLSPRTSRRAISTISPAETPAKGKGKKIDNNTYSCFFLIHVSLVSPTLGSATHR